MHKRPLDTVALASGTVELPRDSRPSQESIFGNKPIAPNDVFLLGRNVKSISPRTLCTSIETVQTAESVFPPPEVLYTERISNAYKRTAEHSSEIFQKRIQHSPWSEAPSLFCENIKEKVTSCFGIKPTSSEIFHAKRNSLVAEPVHIFSGLDSALDVKTDTAPSSYFLRKTGINLTGGRNFPLNQDSFSKLEVQSSYSSETALVNLSSESQRKKACDFFASHTCISVEDATKKNKVYSFHAQSSGSVQHHCYPEVDRTPVFNWMLDDSLSTPVLQTISIERNSNEWNKTNYQSFLGYEDACGTEEYFDADCHTVNASEIGEKQPIYDGATLTLQESLAAVLAFSQAENLSFGSLSRLLQLIDLHLPHPNLFPTTPFGFFKHFDSADSPLHLYYYCNICLSPRTSALDLCDVCVSPDRSVNYFLHLPLIPQISKLVTRSGFLNDIKYKETRIKKNFQNIEDIYDGRVYKDAEQSLLSDLPSISLQWNSDGVSPFVSSSLSIWPFYFVVNELPPSKRFKKENMIIAGIWVGYEKPHPNIFLRPIYKEIEFLNSEGLSIRVPISDNNIKLKVAVVCGTCDTPAKAAFLNMKSHTGYSSCPKCTIVGEKSVRTSDVLVFPHKENLDMRTEENYIEHVKAALQTKDSYCGIKGATLLYFMVFSMIRSTSIDGMHCIYLGVFKQLLNLFFNSSYHNEGFTLTKMMGKINKRISTINLPHFAQRDLLPVDKLIHWKASLLRNFMLYLALPVFFNVLEKQYFDHVQLFIAATALLNTDSISTADIEVADMLIKKFVLEFEKLFGLRHMSFNVHLLRHLPGNVMENGPLWANSCFGFEKLNNDIMKTVHGSRHVGLQIASHLNLLTELPTKIDKLPYGPSRYFCQKISNKYNRLDINENVSGNTYSVGLAALAMDCASARRNSIAFLLLGVLVLVSGQDEGYFNGSSYVRLYTPISLRGHVGLNFRTCRGGQLFTQTNNGRSISLEVRDDALILRINTAQKQFESRLSARLLDDMWHNVNLVYRLGNLTLTAASHSQIVANSTYNSEILSDLELSSKNAVLLVGDGFVGCILQGPSLVFNTTAMDPVNVQWGTCPLQDKSCSKVDHCINEPCLRHGVCLSLSDRYDCRCSARYSGKNCEVDNGSPCAPNPCHNEGHCVEDFMGNYNCHCGPAHTGLHCETEISSLICENNPCQNNGTCRVSAVGNHYECTCMPGFSGIDCEININECQSNPCQHGGICMDGINNYTCNCNRTGYVGQNCEVNINECIGNPCLNQGRCFDNYGSYTCQCKSGFAGQNCEQNLNECSSNPCLNNAHCVDVVGSYECHCQHGFTGHNCETNMNECESNVCPPNSDCVDGNGSYQCVCKAGLTGEPPNCSEVNICTSNPCVNGATCVVVGDHYNCSCLPGFSGKMCQINIDECASNPCQNGGTCIDHVNSYLCNCSDEYMGVHCELDFDACAFKPCKNGGDCVTQPRRKEFYCECARGFDGLECTINIDDCVNVTCPLNRVCVDLVDGYECRCQPGYSGDNCTLDVDYCASSPCRNNGSCHNTGGSFVCDCPLGYKGLRCDQDVDECHLSENLCNHGICVNNMGSYDCFCRPGFTGSHCNLDFDECLSRPCQNNATCQNLINSFNCICTPGYTGRECSIDINECDSNPCQNNSTCIDGIATFSCICPPGLTGRLCETNIDDCESSPCLHNGVCKDGFNSYSCECSDTGYSGIHCENNIDDCLSNPCTNGADCVDGVKDYTCNCFPGFDGKNCEIDVNECESSPCQYGGTCLQHSNVSLYEHPTDHSLPSVFSRKFSFENASGYECVCVPGITGSNCEININECESNPCHWGTCNDKIGGYDCECEEGFTGTLCDFDIDECELYKPCVHGTCIDRRANYFCDCPAKYGGKNCSVELIGCELGHCENNGTCKPYLENETSHKFNCSCPNGFHGDLCEKVTTMSLNGKSHVLVNKSRDEGYDIQFRFKTTLPDGLLAIGRGSTFYILELVHGRLNLHSSLLNKWEGVFIGSGLNDSNWQKVFVAINSSHVVLAANEEQTIYPINLNEGSSASHTSFPLTYLGGTTSSLRRLTHGPPSFVGCVEDVVINNFWALPEDPGQLVTLENVTMGCPREPQCSPNPCHNGGHCTDLWSNFSCACERPFLGHTCQYNFTAATFGHENITNSSVTVSVHDQARRAVRSIVDISMFIRTRQSKGVIFQLGSSPMVPHQDQTQIAAQLDGGELFVGIQFNGTPEGYTVGGVKLDDGNNHLIQVVRNVTLVQVKINGTEYFRKTISASGQLDVQVLYLGGVPSNARVNFRPGVTPDYRNFKGIIQDVQISNGSRTMVTEFFPLKANDLEVPVSFGNVMFPNDTILEGVISDKTCLSNPCLHNGSCIVTWNDFSCECIRGYKGKTCQEMEFCQLQDCPLGSSCRNLNDGYECVANATFNGVNSSLTYILSSSESVSSESPLVPFNSVDITYRSRTGGTLVHVSSPDEEEFFSVSVFKDQVTVAWKLGSGHGRARRLRKEHADGEWASLHIVMKGTNLDAHFQHDEWSEEAQGHGAHQFTEPDFPIDAWNQLLANGKVVLGGGPSISVSTVAVLGEQLPLSNYVVYDHDATDFATSTSSLDSNAVDFPMSSRPTEESHTQRNGGYFKGCLGEVRIGGLLLPFFTQDQLNMDNMTISEFFYLTNPANGTGVNTDVGCFLCFESECQNNGWCASAKESYACTCPPGFEHDDCSINTDECVENNCQNNATCIDGIANYTCGCRIGWTGWLCDVDINECESNPCQNNGTCLDKLGRFECICTSEFEGPQCQYVKMVNCDSSPCKNGSSCRDVINLRTGDNFTCSCATGFEGTYCDKPYCEVEPCQQGLCDVSQSVPFCNCSPGFTGRFCEVNINECEVGLERSSPCRNRGLCIDGINTFACDCSATGYTGPGCEEDVDECQLNPQLCGSGTCVNLIGSYRCNCTLGFCGDNCSLLDPCIQENPCQFDGKCIEHCFSQPDYFCDCTEGHTGKNCTESPVYAASNPYDVAIIVAPIVGALLLIAAGGLVIFIMMARKKRATRGTYSPSQQEYCNPRVEMDNVMKPPPEERLI